MTDSVNCSAFAESMRREICAIVESGELISPASVDEIARVGKIPEMAIAGNDLSRSGKESFLKKR
jgi:hypothetical protein